MKTWKPQGVSEWESTLRISNIVKLATNLQREPFEIQVIASFWILSFNFSFNYENAKDDCRLFKFWMNLTMELPVKSEDDYRVAGLPREINKKFWSTENYVNYVLYRVLNWYIAFISLVYSHQLFMTRLSTFLD